MKPNRWIRWGSLMHWLWHASTPRPAIAQTWIEFGWTRSIRRDVACFEWSHGMRLVVVVFTKDHTHEKIFCPPSPVGF